MEIFQNVFLFYHLFSQELRANNVTSACSEQQQHSSDVKLSLGAVISGVCSVLAQRNIQRKASEKRLTLNGRANNVKLFHFLLKVKSCPGFERHGRGVQ